MIFDLLPWGNGKSKIMTEQATHLTSGRSLA